MAVIGDLHIFDPTPQIDVEADAPDVYRITLKSMITTWWVLLGSWAVAGVIVALLGHPLIGAAQAGAGVFTDWLAQAHLRKQLSRAKTAGTQRDVAGLGWIVILRYSLGVSGPLAACLIHPSIAADTVLVLMQGLSICVAVVQFAHTTHLMKRALAPLFVALLVGLAPAALSEGRAAIGVLLAVGLLAWVVLVVARELNILCRQWIDAIRRNMELLAELGRARDAAIAERDLAVVARAEAGRANTAKSAFLATISHEIRTPLNGVLGMAQAMQADDLSPAQAERLTVIRQSGENLLAILNDLLDISKIEAGKLDLEEVAFDLEAVARGAHAVFAPLAAQKGIGLTLALRGAEGTYLGDPTRLRQVLTNLISNGVKFTERGSVDVAVMHDGRQLTVTVSDTGIGMGAQGLSRLFNSFTQADSSTTRRFGGTGLGLAICKRLADLMNGEIRADSAEGAGTVFVFTAPIPRLADLPDISVDPVPVQRALAGLRVLAAEDHPANRLVLKALLEQIEVQPVMVENGALAVEAWEAGAWDLILMDVQMPVLDGPGAVRAIRAREAALGRPRTPVLALTANALSHHVDDYFACGMDGHVAKPIEAAKLYRALQDAIDGPRPDQDQARRLSAT